MKQENRRKLIKTIFKPTKKDKVLFIVDVPHSNIYDNWAWKTRRKMAEEWCKVILQLNVSSCNLEFFNATGADNGALPKEFLKKIKKYTLVIAMTEFSVTSSLKPLCDKKGSKMRSASMPGATREMEDTAMSADYNLVASYARTIEYLLNKSVCADIEFSTGDKLIVDLRHRIAERDDGDCSKAGQSINFPAGEGFKVPYEATKKEISSGFGMSNTFGIMPFVKNKQLVKFKIANNRIVEVIGKNKEAINLRNYFFNYSCEKINVPKGEHLLKYKQKTLKLRENRVNIAEFGIGCNPNAIISGNTLEDEKVGGLHIAHGASLHIGGRVDSDTHQDIVYAKDLPIEATTVTLILNDFKKIKLIKNSKLRYSFLKKLAKNKANANI